MATRTPYIRAGGGRPRTGDAGRAGRRTVFPTPDGIYAIAEYHDGERVALMGYREFVKPPTRALPPKKLSHAAAPGRS